MKQFCLRVIHHPAVTVGILLPALVLFTYERAQAQSLDAPDTVCIGDEFEVEWSGPDGTGDQIAIAESSFPASQNLAARLTSGGNPAEMEAPAQEGFFEIRYVQAQPESILIRRGIVVQNCLSSATGAGSTGTSDDSGTASTSEYAAGVNQAVLVQGVQTNYGDVVHEQPAFGEFDGTLEALCGASDTIGWAMSTMVDEIERSMTQAGSPITFDFVEALPGAPTREGIRQSVRRARDEVCQQQPPPPQVQPFAITYAYCRMAMVTPYQVMDIHLPPQIGTGTMSAADYTQGEAMQITLSRGFDAAATVTGAGWSSQVQMTAPMSGGTRIGYPTTRYEFTYSGGLGGPGSVPMAGMVSTETSGTVWVSEAVPGLDIVRSFYNNLTREVSPDQAGNSFFAGLVNNLVGMLRNGLPLKIDQTIESKIMGRTSVSGRSHSVITDVRLVEFRPEWCSESLLPPNMPVQDINQQISEAMGQSGAQSAEMAEALQQYNEAMQNMTPEDRRMMEQMGMGNMMEQMMGGANPGAQQQMPTAPPQQSSSAGSNMPSSDDLQGGSMTETAQMHLQALGYDVGEANGDMSLDTTIAISTFQAEKGMDVTGEVTPQLLGALSAEVDSRR